MSLGGSRWVLFLFAVILAGALAVLYGGYLDAPALFDDGDFFAGNYVSFYASAIQPLTLRFWAYASFAHEKLLLGHDLRAMHMGNVVLHLLCMMALHRLLVALLAAASSVDDAKEAVRRELAAAAAVAMYALHPVAVYAVAYVVERTILLATLFSLLMLLTYLRGLQSGRAAWYVSAVVCFYFAVFSKEHAVVMPLVAVGLTILVAPRTPLRTLLPVYAAFVVIMAVAVAQRMGVVGATYEPYLAYGLPPAAEERLFLLKRIHWWSILAQGRLFFSYLRLWVWPNGDSMSVDMREAVATDLSDPLGWLGLSAYAAFGAAALVCLFRRGRTGLLGLGLLVVWVLFALELSVVRFQEPFVLYRSYLWMVGLALAVAVVLDAAARRIGPTWMVVVSVAVCTVLAWEADGRLRTFASGDALWGDAVRLFEARSLPHVGAERAYHNRGVARLERRDYTGAMDDFNCAIGFNPNFYPAYLERAQALLAIGRYDAALADLDRTLTIRRDFSSAHVSRAVVLERLGRHAEAMAELDETCTAGNVYACWLVKREASGDKH